MGRGEVTSRVIEIAEEHNFDINTTKLRLLAHIDYQMKNEQKINPRHVNDEERDILQEWREEGYLSGGASGLVITHEFYNIMQALLWQAYVVQQGGELDPEASEVKV